MANARALFAAADLDMPGHSAGPTNIGTFGFDGPQLQSATWDARDGNGRFMPQIERFLNYGQPPSSSSAELTTVPITWQYQIPESIDGSPSLLMPGMPVFSVTERGPADLDVTVILSLAKINQYAREQWDDFVTFTSGDSRSNPHFNFELKKFHNSMRVYGERGLRDYHYARKNAHHDGVARKLLDKCDAKPGGNTAPHEEKLEPNAEKYGYLSLREYYERSTQPGYCYLTQFGFLQRLRFIGFVQTINKGVMLEDCMEEGEHVQIIAAALAKQVEVTNCFGTDEEIGLGSKLWIELTRVSCPGAPKGDVPFGAFQLNPRGSKIHDYPRFCDIGYLDESATMVNGYFWRVGVVIEPPGRAVEQSSITQANNSGMMSNPELAYKMNSLLPTMRVAVGFKN